MIDRSQVEHIARLARLSISEEDKEALTEQLSAILGYMEKLNSLNTEGIEPTSHVLEISNVFRDDEPTPSLSPDDALRNAPERSDNFYKVPRIIE